MANASVSTSRGLRTRRCWKSIIPFWHAGVEASHRDKNRDLDMGAIGWQTMRITDLNVNVGLPIAIAKVAATLDLRPRTL